jgi:penicillin amidase
VHEWQGYIPQAHNPHAVNPERGFVSSANQHAADESYPYYYQGVVLEYYRNRRLNQQLMMMEQATKEEMKRLQTDNYNLQAAEAMPTLLSYVEEMELSGAEEKAYDVLKTWNFMNDAELEAPSIYEAFWVKVHRKLWDELEMPEGTPMVFPNRYVTTQLLITQPKHELIDFEETPEKETAKEIVQMAFKEAVKEFYADDKKAKTWAAYRGSKIEHLARINPFSLENLKIGGYKGILNAMRGKNGPSWRMIVSLDKDKPTAFGIYPGGQSGNPGSPYYTNFVKKWTEGEYSRLLFMTDVNEPIENVWARQTFVKE